MMREPRKEPDMYKSCTGAIAVMAYQHDRSRRMWNGFDANQLRNRPLIHETECRHAPQDG